MRSGRLLAVLSLAVAFVALILAAVAFTTRPTSPTVAGTLATAAPVLPNGQVRTFSVQLGDLWVRPSSISVASGTRAVLRVENRGGESHDLQLEGGKVGTGMLDPGQSRTVDIGLVGQTEQLWCTVPGHKAAGMILTITVPGSTPLGTSRAAGTATHDAVLDPAATPPSGWHPLDPVLQPAPSGTVHRITLVAEDRELPVAPGVTQDMWTFNGQVPAPILRGQVGDLFEVTLVNRSTMGHSLDFHAASQPTEAMATVAPGHSMTEEFVASHAGIFLYHCGTPPILEHLANGMYGAVIVDPPILPPVSEELVMVQSELYFGPPGRSGDYSAMLAGRASAVVFNGYADGYAFSPIHVPAGKPIRIWVLDAGPSDDTSFHVIGAQFGTVFKEGAYLLQPGSPTEGASQALDLMPGQGGFVELTLPTPGRYAILDHHLDHAAIGAVGYLVAG